MNVNGGIAYIDFKRNSIYNLGSFVCDGIFNNVKKAYESGKMSVICNASSLDSNDIIPTSTVSQIRQRDDTHYIFTFFIADKGLTTINLRYVVVDSSDNVTVSKATIGNL